MDEYDEYLKFQKEFDSHKKELEDKMINKFIIYVRDGIQIKINFADNSVCYNIIILIIK